MKRPNLWVWSTFALAVAFALLGWLCCMKYGGEVAPGDDDRTMILIP